MGQSSSKSSVVEGFVAPGYENVREMFERNFRRGADESSQLCVYVGDEVVVDLWTTRDGFTAESLLNIFSSGKSITALAVAHLVGAGLVSYEDKISSHWPEFAENGKSEITIADLMRHESGLASLDQSIKPSGSLTAQTISVKFGGMPGWDLPPLFIQQLFMKSNLVLWRQC